MGRVARREAGYLGGIGLRTGSIETEIVGGVDIHEEGVGYDAWGHLVRWHDEVLASQMAAYGGDVVRTTGDGIFVTFVDPDAALGCAVAIQEALREHRSKNGFAPWVRIGLHVAEATREGADWSGVGVHAAARIGGLAEAEEILLSTETAEVAGPAYRFSEPRSVTLKGSPSPSPWSPSSGADLRSASTVTRDPRSRTLSRVLELRAEIVVDPRAPRAGWPSRRSWSSTRRSRALEARREQVGDQLGPQVRRDASHAGEPSTWASSSTGPRPGSSSTR